MPDTPFGEKFGRQDMDHAVKTVIHAMQVEITKANGELFEGVAQRLGDICWQRYLRWLEKGYDFKIDREKREYTRSDMSELIGMAQSVARSAAKEKMEQFFDRSEAIDLANEICARIHEAIEESLLATHPELRSEK